MHRILPNILFVLILFILATAFPLSTDILSLNLSQKIIDKPIDESVVTSEISTKLPLNTDTMVNEFITFDIESNTSSIPKEYLSAFSIEVFAQNKPVLTKSLTELTYELVDMGANVKTVKVSKSTLLSELPQGYYTYSLTHEDVKLDYIWYGTNLITDKTLLKTGNTSNVGQMNVTLFFPTYDYKNIVPITRQIPLPTNKWRALYTALMNGPKLGLGLYELPPVLPYAPNIRISNNTANIYMYPSNLVGFDDTFQVVLDAITKTFMTLGPLDGVNFYVNDSNIKPYFGVDLTKTYTQSFTNSAFVGYSHDTAQMLLFPVSLKSIPFEDRIEESFQLMKDTSELSIDMIQCIPDEIKLLDYTLEGTVLSVNLSKITQAILDSNLIYNDLMINSILYTFMSFPEVETVKLTVEGETLILSGYDFSKPIKPNAYINLEP